MGNYFGNNLFECVVMCYIGERIVGGLVKVRDCGEGSFFWRDGCGYCSRDLFNGIYVRI